MAQRIRVDPVYGEDWILTAPAVRYISPDWRYVNVDAKECGVYHRLEWDVLRFVVLRRTIVPDDELRRIVDLLPDASELAVREVEEDDEC